MRWKERRIGATARESEMGEQNVYRTEALLESVARTDQTAVLMAVGLFCHMFTALLVPCVCAPARRFLHDLYLLYVRGTCVFVLSRFRAARGRVINGRAKLPCKKRQKWNCGLHLGKKEGYDASQK